MSKPIKIKESVSEMSIEKLDGKAECEKEYQEEYDRNSRINGWDEQTLGGFVKRNNVRDRI